MSTVPPLQKIYDRLYSQFGPQHWWPAQTRFEVMVGAILTQNTNWGNVEKAIQNLKKELKITKGELRLACQCFPSTEGTDLICVWVPHKSAPDLRNT